MKNLGDNSLSPTEQPPQSSLAKVGTHGSSNVLRHRVSSLEMQVKTLEDTRDRLQGEKSRRGMLIEQALCYIQPGRDALPDNSILKTEVSRWMHNALQELGVEDLGLITGRLANEQAERFIELIKSPRLVTEDVRRYCLNCGGELSEENSSCVQCYSDTERPDSSHALAVGKDVHAKLEKLWVRARQTDSLEDQVRKLQEHISRIENQRATLQEHVDSDDRVTEVRVAGRLLGKLNSMVMNLDGVIREATDVSNALAKELKDSKTDREQIQSAVAEVIQENIARALKPFVKQ